ncbi:MAG: hypothetical protein DSY55_04315 [Clostridia bacterium]|nr:MAG: hypothetical protein DSY55_04315 [Clostridia bacterium]
MLRQSKNRLYLPLTLFFSLLWLLFVLLTPPERTLGTLIRWVFAHGSLTQASVLVFLAAALFSAGYLLGNHSWRRWLLVTGWVAFGLWVLGFLVSMIPARLAWGVWIDFHEPRTQMMLRIMVVGLIFLIITQWVKHPQFTAIAQILFTFILLFLVRSTGMIRHPANPIGESPNAILPVLYSGAFFAATLATLCFSGWLVNRKSLLKNLHPGGAERTEGEKTEGRRHFSP